jgi:redox-sensitive bicupin YhaK (pirin superfamily)
MTIAIRPSEARGHARHGWLDSRHTFSFGQYYDEAHMGFRSLRVINEDRIDPASGFPTHPHRDMEIISYVVEGALAHRDTTGADGVIRPGDIQAMSAGTGVRHSEYNDLVDSKTRFLQIWIIPDKSGHKPRYGQIAIPDAEKKNALRLLVGPEEREGSLRINQDARIYGSLLDAGNSVSHQLAPGRGAWVQVVDGEIDLNGTRLSSGDGAQIEDVGSLDVTAKQDTEFLLFDLA